MRALLLAWLLSAPLAASPLQGWLLNGKYHQALVWIDRQLLKPGRQDELLLQKVRCLLATDQTESARKLLQALPVQNSAFYFLEKGRLDQELRENSQAAAEYEQALKMSGPLPAVAEAGAALACLEASKNWERAQQLWNEAVARASRCAASADWAQLYLLRIKMLRTHGWLEEALTTCRLACQACAAHQPAHRLNFRLEEAGLLVLLGREEEADDLYLELAGDWPDSPRYWLISGVQMALGKARSQRLAAARRWLKLSQKVALSDWTAYDRFYFRLFQGYIQFVDEKPAGALRAFAQAEKLLGKESRLAPSGNGVRISLAFHQLSPEGQSELGLCCWASAATMMQAGYPDAVVDRFMEQHSSRMPASERVAWLVMLGNNYRKNLDARSWKRYQESLDCAPGGEQRLLLLTTLLQKRMDVAALLNEQLKESSREVQRRSLEELLRTAALERLSAEGMLLGPNQPLDRALQAALQLEPELDQRYRQGENDSRQSRNHFSIASSSQKLAYLQIAQNRLLEAQASLWRALAKESSRATGLRLKEQVATLQVLSGRPEAGLAELDRLRQEREALGGRGSGYWDLVLRQAALADLAGKTDLARQLAQLTEGKLDPFRQHLLQLIGPRGIQRDPLGLLAGASPSQIMPPPVSLEWLSGAEFLARLSQVRQQYPEFETAVAALPPQFLELGQKQKPDTLLIEYFVAPFETYQMLSFRGRFALRRLEVDRELLQGWVADLRRQVSSQPRPATASRILYDLLVPNLPERPRLLIIPQGPLYGLPWDLLVNPEERWFGEEADFCLWAPEATQSQTWSSPQQLLGVGDVSGAQLPASRAETVELSQAFAGHTDLLLGEQATSRRLAENLNRYDVVHLATHARLDPPSIQLSDGNLPIEQIYRLPLKPGSLVVLSQCGSGDAAGQPRSPMHLASAFLAAGASRVIATLTPVGDEEVSRFMGIFYGHLRQGLTPDQALRQSKVDFRALSHYGDWASFVLISGL